MYTILVSYSELLILKDSHLSLNHIYGIISNFEQNYCFMAGKISKKSRMAVISFIMKIVNEW